MADRDSRLVRRCQEVSGEKYTQLLLAARALREEGKLSRVPGVDDLDRIEMILDRAGVLCDAECDVLAEARAIRSR